MLFHFFFRIFLLYSLTLLISFGVRGVFSSEVKPGKAVGISPVVIPDWWKDSFLDITEDAIEAHEQGKHLIVFMHLDDCPYCSKMATEHFNTSDYVPYLKKHFDVIEINVKGDREVTLNDATVLTEKEFATAIKAFYTPILLFVNGETNKMILRVDGYRDHQQFQKIIQFVAQQEYQKKSLSEYISQENQNNQGHYTPVSHPAFVNFKGKVDLRQLNDRPVLFVVEDKSCLDCSRFHQSHLSDGLSQSFFKHMYVVQLDALSDESMIDFSGKSITMQAFVKQNNLYYRPGMMIFIQGERMLIRNSWSVLHHFHTMLDYFTSGAYQTMTRREFGQQRNEALIKQGKNIDYRIYQ